jgi:GTP-binding protein Era
MTPINPDNLPSPDFRCGLAVLIGRANVGKSTLLNALVGTKIAITTPKPQTTRDTYHGIVHRPGGQIVFVDTPGLFKTAPSRLVQNLHHRVRDALEGIDVIVHVVDPSKSVGAEERMVTQLLATTAQPKVLCLNKSDLQSRPYRDHWLAEGKHYASVMEVSALKHDHIDLVINAIMRLLPVAPPQYPDGQVTNVTTEFWIAELIREKIFLNTGQELPYTATVQLEKIEDRKDKQGKPMLAVKAAILTTDERYQRMLIGAGAKKIREIGSAARHELEVAMNRKVFLDLTVIVDETWINRFQ